MVSKVKPLAFLSALFVWVLISAGQAPSYDLSRQTFEARSRHHTAQPLKRIDLARSETPATIRDRSSPGAWLKRLKAGHDGSKLGPGSAPAIDAALSHIAIEFSGTSAGLQPHLTRSANRPRAPPGLNAA